MMLIRMSGRVGAGRAILSAFRLSLGRSCGGRERTQKANVVSGMKAALENRKQERQDEEYRRSISRDFGQNCAGTGAEESVRRRATECQASTCFLFRELHEHQKNEDSTQQNHCERQKADNKTHI